MLTLVCMFSFGVAVLLVVLLKHKLQVVEADIRDQLFHVIAYRDKSGPKMWTHFHAQVRIYQGLLIKHFRTED